MKTGIHPNYIEATVTCACGSVFNTRSTKQDIRLEICSSCHPFYSGRQKFIDTAGRVERFQKRFSKTEGETKKPVGAQPVMAKGQKAALSKKTLKIMSSAPIVIPVKAGFPKFNPKPDGKGDKSKPPTPGKKAL